MEFKIFCSRVTWGTWKLDEQKRSLYPTGTDSVGITLFFAMASGSVMYGKHVHVDKKGKNLALLQQHHIWLKATPKGLRITFFKKEMLEKM